MNNKKLTCFISLLFTAAVQAQSDNNDENSLEETITIIGKPIVEEKIIDLFSSTSTLVSEQQIHDQNAVDLASALRTLPSVQISRFNPVGSFGGNEGGGVFIRGLGASRPGSEIKTYIDGLPFYMGLWNHPLLDLLPLNGMQSITVYKAPQIQTNGNNFASINLSTKKAMEDGIRFNAKISGGEFGTLTQQADIYGRSGRLDFMLAQGYATSDGHRENANGKLHNIMGKVGYDITPHWNISSFFLYTDNEANDPGDDRVMPSIVSPRYDTKANMVSLTLEHQYENVTGNFQLYSNSGDGNWLNQPDLDGDTLTHFDMQGIRWKESITLWQNGLLVLGVDHDEVSGEVKFNRLSPAPSDSFDTPSFRITSPYISIGHEFAMTRQWSLIPSVGIRYYKHSDFDTESTPQIGLSLVSSHATVFANFSKGTNYPGLEVTTLSHLIPALGTSWQTLNVETLEHSEIGIKLNFDTQTEIDIALFENKISDRYIFGFPPHLPPPPQFANVGSYKTRGAELALKQDIGNHWALFTAISLLDPNIENLPYTPERSATLGLNGEWERWRVSMDAQYQGDIWAMNQSRTAGAINTQKVPSFTVVNSRVAYQIPSLGDKGEIFVAMENLLDHDYAYRPGYPMPGRWLQVGLIASFEPNL